jgi:AraC-like DNA-binding protein
MLTRDALSRLCRARALLREVHEPELSIREIARRSGMSVSQLERGFRALFGDSPHQVRIAARIDRAKELLVARGLTVTEACMEVGFTSVGSFSALFRKRVGVSPSVYRRTHRPHVRTPGRMPERLAPGCLSLMARA